MNFDDTPQEAAFRAEARQWIGANAPKQFEAAQAPPHHEDETLIRDFRTREVRHEFR